MPNAKSTGVEDPPTLSRRTEATPGLFATKVRVAEPEGVNRLAHVSGLTDPEGIVATGYATRT